MSIYSASAYEDVCGRWLMMLMMMMTWMETQRRMWRRLTAAAKCRLSFISIASQQLKRQ